MGSRRLYPKLVSDRIAFGFILFTIHVVGFFELLVILPYIDSERNKTYWLHVISGSFIYFNVITSFYKLFTTDSTTAGIILPTVLKPGWRYCSSCTINVPPRSSHCWMCNNCILKRDHHCVFSGNCVSYQNQRYFLTFLFYMVLATGYSNYLNMDYTMELLGGISVKAFVTMLLPLMMWIIGVSGAYTFTVSFISAICIAGFLFGFVLMIYHFQNIYNGQTCTERNSEIRQYNNGWQNNLREIFGNNWKIAWLCPLISSPLPGDGLTFKTASFSENIKDI